MFIPGVTTIFNLDNGRLSTYPYYTVPRWGKTAQGSCPVHQLWRLCDTWLGLQSPAHWANILVIGVSVPPYHRLSDSATGFAIFLHTLLSFGTARGKVMWCCPECSVTVWCGDTGGTLCHTTTCHSLHPHHTPATCLLGRGGYCPHTGVIYFLYEVNCCFLLLHKYLIFCFFTSYSREIIIRK